MTVIPGPSALGRGVILPPDRPPPDECRHWPRVVIDEAAVTAPAGAAALLHEHWLRRRPCVVVLAADAAALRAPEQWAGEVWSLEGGFEFSRERLQYLAWSNNYDLRGPEPIWWHGRRAERLGAVASSSEDGDVVLPDGRRAFCDGGPREPLYVGVPVVHRETLEAGCLDPDRVVPLTAPLAPDQAAAVAHGAGPARVIAPAGSGKTRVLTERLRHLLADRRVTPSTVTAVAYNKRAADELAERTVGLPAHLRTLNSLGLAIVNGAGPFARRDEARRVVEEAEVRRLLESLVSVRRQQNTDPWAPYLEALSAIRLGLVDPAGAEEAYPDAVGVADAFPRYRERLAEGGLLDFDEQIYRAIEIMLTEPETRRHNQGVARHLLVDEFQDLTPAHLLLLRLLSAPTYDVFGVGDDDQVIYSYAGATPEYLIEYGRYFPGAAEYALETNYRCPPEIVIGARNLLGYNRRRIPKSIRAVPGRAESGRTEGGRTAANKVEGGLIVDVRPPGHQVTAVLEHIGRLQEAGAACSDIAVLTRVNASLLPVQVTVSEAGIPCSAPLGASVLSRTGIRAALAYLRVGADPGHISRADLAETIRRPSRRIARNVVEMLSKRSTTSMGDIRRLARALSGGDVEKLRAYADDLEVVAAAVAGADTASALACVRLEVGLGGAMAALDNSKGDVEGSSHLDDLSALEAVARMHPEAGSFESWLREVLGRKGAAGGVELSTVHRVKGREWPYVIVFGADDGLFPHRLAADTEEERRIFHVAVTRAGSRAFLVADANRPSPFCAELFAEAPEVPTSSGGGMQAPFRAQRERAAARPSDPPTRNTELAPAAAAALVALRAWRTDTSRRDKVPAYVVFSDAHLEGIARAAPSSLAELARCKGIGPAKLERYGDDLLCVLEATSAAVPG